MTTTIPSLWPNTFKSDVQTPLAILQQQAEGVAAATNDILKASVDTESGGKKVQHRLVLIAPYYRNFRHTLIVVLHNVDLVYPAEIQAESVKKTVKSDITNPMVGGGPFYDNEYPTVLSEDEMMSTIRNILHSDQTRAVILAMIAKSNEARYASGIVLPRPGASGATISGETPAQHPLEETDPD